MHKIFCLNNKISVLTSASLFEIRTAIPQLQAGMIAIARLIAQILDDRVYRRLLYDTGRVPARTTEFRLPTTAPQHVALQESPQNVQQQEDTKDHLRGVCVSTSVFCSCVCW